MANQKPVVLVSGELQQLQAGDTLVDGSGAAIGSGGGALIVSIAAKSADFTVVAGDKGKLYAVTTGASTITATLPAAVTAGADWYIFLQKADAGVGAIVTSPASVNPTLLTLMEQYDLVLIWTDGTSYYASAMPGSFDAAATIAPLLFAIASLRL